jgi:hypothetical protein
MKGKIPMSLFFQRQKICPGNVAALESFQDQLDVIAIVFRIAGCVERI